MPCLHRRHYRGDSMAATGNADEVRPAFPRASACAENDFFTSRAFFTIEKAQRVLGYQPGFNLDAGMPQPEIGRVERHLFRNYLVDGCGHVTLDLRWGKGPVIDADLVDYPLETFAVAVAPNP